MPYVEGKWIGPLETFYQSSYDVDYMDGHLNRLRREALRKELWGLGIVLNLEFPHADEPINSLSGLIEYLRKKYAKKCRLPEDASFEDIRKKIDKKTKVKK